MILETSVAIALFNPTRNVLSRAEVARRKAIARTFTATFVYVGVTRDYPYTGWYTTQDYGPIMTRVTADAITDEVNREYTQGQE